MEMPTTERREIVLDPGGTYGYRERRPTWVIAVGDDGYPDRRQDFDTARIITDKYFFNE